MTMRGVRALLPFSVLALAAVVLAASALAPRAGSAGAEIPAAIAAPGETPVVTLHAAGAQIYECKAGADGALAWAFREPIATLLFADKTVGRHYAGPTWEHADGSAVTAKAAGNAPGETANDVAWLKLEVVGRRGSGTFDAVNTVQRINTLGGVLHGACGEAGALASVPYSADYVFLGKGG